MAELLVTKADLLDKQKHCMERERYYTYWNGFTGSWDVAQEQIGKSVPGVTYYSTRGAAHVASKLYSNLAGGRTNGK